MTPRLGLLLDNAEIVDHQTKGKTTVLTIQARGVTKRACKRGAKKEASSVIPATEQNIINETEMKSGRFNESWMLTIADGDSN